MSAFGVELMTVSIIHFDDWNGVVNNSNVHHFADDTNVLYSYISQILWKIQTESSTIMI